MTALALPSVNSRSFRGACSLFATGVAVVTARAGGHRAGMTVNSFASVSLDPPLVLWNLRDASKSRTVFETSGFFAINILAAGQKALALRFASGIPNPFEGVDVVSSSLGLPLLAGVLAHLECTLHSIYDGGDHRIMVGRVAALNAREGDPLLFFKGAFSGLAGDFE